MEKRKKGGKGGDPIRELVVACDREHLTESSLRRSCTERALGAVVAFAAAAAVAAKRAGGCGGRGEPTVESFCTHPNDVDSTSSVAGEGARQPHSRQAGRQASECYGPNGECKNRTT